jgi:hypothetical protein
MDLIDFLAKGPGYWDFIDKGRVPEEGSMIPKLDNALPQTITPSPSFVLGDDTNSISTDSSKKSSKGTRWNDSPLTLGAKMGLHELVERILNVCPQSAGNIYIFMF